MFASDNVALLVTFDQTIIEPNSPCDGSIEVEGALLDGTEPVLFGPVDSVAGSRWSCRMNGTPEKPGFLRQMHESARRKGIVVKLRKAKGGSVRFRTVLGTFAVELDTLKSGERRYLGGKVVVQQVPYVTRLSSRLSEDDFPSIACGKDGRVWVAWQSWEGQADQLFICHNTENGWSKPTTLSLRPGDYYRVTLASQPDGTIWAVWGENRNGNWDLWSRRWAGEWEAPIRLTTVQGSDFNQRLTSDADGRVHIVWQGERNGQYDIFKAVLTPQGLVDTKRVTSDTSNDWEPAIAESDGLVTVAWDTYRNGNYDIYLRTYGPDGSASAPFFVACSANYEVHASIAYDREGRLWVAWDEADPRGKGGLHKERRVRLCCMDGDQRSIPSVPPFADLTSQLEGMWELPRISFDRLGCPVLIARHLMPIKRWRPKKGQSRGIWSNFVTRFDGVAWSPPMLLCGSDGRNDQRVSITREPDGELWVAFGGDGREIGRAEVPENNNVFAGRISLDHSSFPIRLVPESAPPVQTLLEAERPSYETECDGLEFNLIYGDVHRHTDISRCNMNYDGSLTDQYRYAIDSARLDFLAITDHDQDLLKHRYDHWNRPLQGYAWWRSQKFCDLFFIPDTFIPLYAYEHACTLENRGGHKNVLFASRGNPVIEDNMPRDLFKALEGKNAIIIPHQLADGKSAFDWTKWNNQWEPIAEIFQARGSYEYVGAPRSARIQREGHCLWDALARGIRIGVIASSDHGFRHGAYAGVYVKEKTREGIFEAMRARRTYAATDTIVLDFRIDGYFMGDEAFSQSAPELEARIIGTDKLDCVDVIRNNQIWRTFSPDGKMFTFSYTDCSLLPGNEAYYYVRCVQKDNEMAWSSPIWVRRE